jgi:hypothetical protein
MANVVDRKTVSVVPAAHVELSERGPVVGPEGLVEQQMTVGLIGRHDAGCVGEHFEGEGLEESAFPMEVFVRRDVWCGGEWRGDNGG